MRIFRVYIISYFAQIIPTVTPKRAFLISYIGKNSGYYVFDQFFK